MEACATESEAFLWDWWRLTNIKGIGWQTASSLVESFGSPAAVLSISSKELASAGFSDHQIRILEQAKNGDDERRFEHTLRWLEHPQHHLLTPFSPLYPEHLRAIDAAPMLLYGVGDAALLSSPQIAIVGTRRPTRSGEQITLELSEKLVSADITVTSGMALGVDGVAHRAALNVGGNTIAVAGTGLDRVYPARHKTLAEQIAERGLLVSEFPLGTGVRSEHFPRRNRIISGLSFGVVVAEAAIKSGSLITAQLALEQGRDVFAVPGSINNPMARGCHQLLKHGAYLIDSADALLLHLSESTSYATNLHSSASSQASQADNSPTDQISTLSSDSRNLLTLIDFAPTLLDQLIDRSKMPVAEVSAKLLTLELAGWIEAVPGGYQRLR